MTLVEVVKIVGRTGIYGEVIQVMCKIIEGSSEGRIVRRNVRSPVRKGDVLDLREVEREVKPLK